LRKICATDAGPARGGGRPPPLVIPRPELRVGVCSYLTAYRKVLYRDPGNLCRRPRRHRKFLHKKCKTFSGIACLESRIALGRSFDEQAPIVKVVRTARRPGGVDSGRISA